MNSISMFPPNNAWYSTTDINDQGALEQEQARLDEQVKITPTFNPFSGYQSIFLMEQRQQQQDEQQQEDEDDQDIEQYADDLQVPDEI